MTGREPGLWVIQVIQVPALEEVRVGLAETGNEKEFSLSFNVGESNDF